MGVDTYRRSARNYIALDRRYGVCNYADLTAGLCLSTSLTLGPCDTSWVLDHDPAKSVLVAAGGRRRRRRRRRPRLPLMMMMACLGCAYPRSRTRDAYEKCVVPSERTPARPSTTSARYRDKLFDNARTRMHTRTHTRYPRRAPPDYQSGYT